MGGSLPEQCQIGLRDQSKMFYFPKVAASCGGSVYAGEPVAWPKIIPWTLIKDNPFMKDILPARAFYLDEDSPVGSDIGREMPGGKELEIPPPSARPCPSASGHADTSAEWAAGSGEDEGRLVCFCYRVGIRRLARTIRARKLASLEEIRRALHAGGKCGSCLPELEEILRQIHGEAG